jgi:hypothetical protein
LATIGATAPLAVAVVEAIQDGDLARLWRLLDEHPGLATARIGDEGPGGMSRGLLHVVTDWPGHFPDGAATVALLAEAGADVNARFAGPHAETPLHWAASSNDVAVLDALLDAGADIEASGGVIGGGTPLADARAFAQWEAAHRLVARGARTTVVDAATLGLLDRLEGSSPARSRPPRRWSASPSGAPATAASSRARPGCWTGGAELNWIPPWEDLTPLDAAERRGTEELVAWLRDRGASSAAELHAT